MRCADCKYFYRDIAGYEEAGGEVREVTLDAECRRYPPKVVHYELTEPIEAIFPPVEEHHYCGEFKAR